MKEIKFRAWDKIEKKMLCDIDELSFPFIAKGNVVEVSPNDIFNFSPDYIWQQYTGLKDKNGVEVFEGDFVKEIDQFGRVYEVVWYDNGWSLSIEPYHNRHFKDVFQMEVIGNIFSNPELLEEQSQ